MLFLPYVVTYDLSHIPVFQIVIFLRAGRKRQAKIFKRQQTKRNTFQKYKHQACRSGSRGVAVKIIPLPLLLVSQHNIKVENKWLTSIPNA